MIKGDHTKKNEYSNVLYKAQNILISKSFVFPNSSTLQYLFMYRQKNVCATVFIM